MWCSNPDIVFRKSIEHIPAEVCASLLVSWRFEVGFGCACACFMLYALQAWGGGCLFVLCGKVQRGGGDKATTGKHEMTTLQLTCHRTNRGTEAEPQQIVAQRLLSCLQYHVPIKSSTEDLTRPTLNSVVK